MCLPKSLPSCYNGIGRDKSELHSKGRGFEEKKVTKCWEEIQNEVLARAYLLYHQIVNTMIVNNGKNDFYTKRVKYILDAEVIYSWRGWRRSTLHPGRQQSWRAGYDTSRKWWKVETSAAEYLNVFSENVTKRTAKQLFNFGNSIWNYVGRSGSKLGSSVG